jgi:hypothetical protein
MSEREPPAPAEEPAKKAWVDPELAVFPMSDAEATSHTPGGIDLGSNSS